MTHQPNNVSAAGVLLPCPMCNGAAFINKGYCDGPQWPGEFHRVYCGSCQLRQLFHKTPAEAITAWNRLAAASAQATAPVGWFVQRSSFGPWIEVERYEDGAVRLHRMDGDQATGPAVQFTPSQLATLYMALGHFKSSGSVKCADSIMSIIKMDRG
jgi:hypothetical protein